MRVRVDLNLSLDGFGTVLDATPDNPMSADWMRIVGAYVATRTMRQRVFGDTSGAGTTGLDDEFARAYFEGIGAEIMGAGMFGLQAHPDDPAWRGWWGPNPPFHCPVYVLTQTVRPKLEMEGGTTFHFVGSAEEAFRLATDAAGDRDVRIGGGPTTVRWFLDAGLVDALHVAIAPVILGQGVRLWDDLRRLEEGYRVEAQVADSGTIHVVFTR